MSKSSENVHNRSNPITKVFAEVTDGEPISLALNCDWGFNTPI